MEPELANRLARTVVVFGLDGARHQAFAQGMGRAGDVTANLATQRVRQDAPNEELVVVVIALGPYMDLEWTLCHEFGHVINGDTSMTGACASSLTDAELSPPARSRPGPGSRQPAGAACAARAGSGPVARPAASSRAHDRPWAAHQAVRTLPELAFSPPRRTDPVSSSIPPGPKSSLEAF
jgi:hypothetical protein